MVVSILNNESYKINKNFIQYLVQINALNYLYSKAFIDENHFKKASVQIKKSYIGK